MKLIKRITTLVLVLSMVILPVFVMTGCPSPEDDDKTLKLMVYAPANNAARNVYKAMLDEFTAETGYKVNVNFVPKDNYNTKLRTSFKTESNAPDVFYLDQPTLADYADMCMNLDEGFFAADGEEGLHLSDFYDVAIDTVKYNGSTLAVPFSLTSSVLLYNKSLVSKVPEDWTEWRNMSVPSGKALFGGIGSSGYASWYFQAFLKSAGGDMISGNEVIFNNAQGQVAASMLVDLYANSPKNIRESANAFTNGNVMFVLAHNSDIINYYSSNPTWCEQNLGATLFIPQTKGGTSYSNIGGENIAIYKNTDKADAAKELVKFLLREENVNKAISTNFSAIKAFAKVPTADAVTGEAYSAGLQEALSVVLKQLETASARPVVKNWIQVNDNYLATALSKILEGEDIKTSLDEAQQQATSILEFK